MNNNQGYNLLLALNALENTNIEFPAKIGYTILKNKKALMDVLQPFDEIRTKIIQKYSEDGGVTISSDNPNFQKCVDEINEIGTQECEAKIRKVNIDDLNNAKIPMNMLSALSEMIEE